MACRIHARLLGVPLLALALVVLAGPVGTTPTQAAAAPARTSEPVRISRPALPALAVVAALGETASAAERPSWHHLPLTDARTGQVFTLADFAGKTVFVEPMATWCTNCRRQLSILRDELRPQLDPERHILLALSVETSLIGAALASYADSHGFGWTFAVATPELLQELAATFGRTVANPPATPHFVIGPSGATSDLATGIHAADAILAQLLAAEM